MTIKTGLYVAHQRRYQHLILESDSACAIHLLQHPTNHRFTYLLSDCRSLLQKFSRISIQHTYTEGNATSDALASMALLADNLDLMTYDFPPLLVREFYVQDLLYVHHPRYVSATMTATTILTDIGSSQAF